PYRDREIKTIGYWLNKDFPDELQDPVGKGGKPTSRGAAEDITYSWTELLSSAVAVSREVECRRTGGDRQACHDQFFQGDEMLSFGGWLVGKVTETQPVLTLCHNPVREYDPHE